MKVSILLSLFLLFVSAIHSQKKDSVLVLPDDADITFTKTEIEPSFGGGEPAWNVFLAKNLDYYFPW